MSDDVLHGFTTVLVLGSAIVLLRLLLRTARRSARKPKYQASDLGWALLFFTSGRTPPPPPASQIEAELNGERDRLESRSIDLELEAVLEASALNSHSAHPTSTSSAYEAAGS
jgi:hypothetical protein